MSPASSHPNFKRTLLPVLAAYSLIAGLITWPVVQHLATVVGGFAGRDSFQHVWLNWWFREALLHQQQLPSDVTALYFPTGASHPVLWLHPLVNLLSLPLTISVGPTAAYNVMLMLSISLSGFTAYLLAYAVVRQSPAAFIGGLIFALAPTRLGHTVAGHQLLAFNVALPLYTLALWQWLRRPTRRTTALYIVSLLLVLLTHPNFIGYFLLPVTLVLLLVHWQRHGNFSQRQWLHLFVSWLIVGLAFLPFAWPFVTSLLGQNLAYLTPADSGEHSADLLSFITPSPFHPLWQNEPPPWLTTVLNNSRALEEGFNYLGLVGLALAGLALWQRRSMRLWAALALLCGVLALGPSLKFNGVDTGLPLPYALLAQLPFFSWSRTPARLNLTTMLAFSVLAAGGASWLFTRYRAWRWPLTMLLAGLIAVEYLPLWPFPVDSLPESPYYVGLGGQAEPTTGLLSLPVTGSRRASNYAMVQQTTHHQPLAGGYIERDPPGTIALKEFLNGLVSPLPEQTVLAAPSDSQRRAILAEMNIGRVVALPALLTDRAAKAMLNYLPQLLGNARYADDQLLAYELSPADRQPLPLITLLPDTGNWEVLADGQQWRLKHTGFLFIYAPAPGCASITIRLGQPAEGVTLTGSLNDARAKAMHTGDPAQFAGKLSLRRGLNYLRLTTVPATELDFIAIDIPAPESMSTAVCPAE